MASEKFSILLQKLLRKTLDKIIRWHETADEKAFRIALGDGLIRIERSSAYDSDGEQRVYCVAYLQDRKGRTLDQMGPLYIDQSGPTAELLSDLFEASRISALGVDNILESMAADIESGQTQPLPQEDEDVPF